MFYMGGMTLGYLTPGSRAEVETKTADKAKNGVRKQSGKSTKRAAWPKLSSLFKPEVQALNRQPVQWPLHVFF